MSVLSSRWRDVWPAGSEGDGHQAGTDCSCNPWAFTDGMIVVVHRDWTEQIIHVGTPSAAECYVDAADASVDWLEVEVPE